MGLLPTSERHHRVLEEVSVEEDRRGRHGPGVQALHQGPAPARQGHEVLVGTRFIYYYLSIELI